MQTVEPQCASFVTGLFIIPPSRHSQGTAECRTVLWSGASAGLLWSSCKVLLGFEALIAHLKAKEAGRPQERRQSFAAPARVINLMEALRRSIAQDKKRSAAARKGASAAPARKRA
jgi:hypothetical protein